VNGERGYLGGMEKVGISAHLHAQTSDFPRFTQDQVDDLARLGVANAQIVALSRALLGCQVSIAPMVPMAEVREQLTDLQSSLKTSLEALRRVRRNTSAAPWEAHLRMRIARAERTSPMDGDRWDDDASSASCAIENALEAVGWALEGLPGEQRRRRSASPEPVRKIHDALLKGWGAEHRGRMMPAFPFVPSSNRTSRFYDIVAICYAAFTGNNKADPERAIKAFMQANRAGARH
jgi:hypothetical protein